MFLRNVDIYQRVYTAIKSRTSSDLMLKRYAYISTSPVIYCYSNVDDTNGNACAVRAMYETIFFNFI
jgi:hypothetical protein